MKKLLCLLFTLSICVPAFGQAVIERGEDYEIQNIGGNQRRMTIGGGIANYRDDAGNYQPVNLSTPETPFTAGFDEYYSKGRIRVEVDTTNGRFRIYPKRLDNASYIEISAVNPVAITTQVINNKYLKIYKDTPNVEYAFIISSRGFKILYKIKNATGAANWANTLNFEVAGNITRTGRQIKYNGNTIFTLPDATWWDSGDDDSRIGGNMQESISGTVVTIPRPDLTGVVYPVFIDPELTFQTADTADTTLRSGGSATKNYGGHSYMLVNGNASILYRGLFKFAYSAIPAGAVIDSAVLSLYYYSWTLNNPVNDQLDILRITQAGWTEGSGTGGAGDTNDATWNNYTTATAWATAGGDTTGTAATATTPDIGASPHTPAWINWTVTSQVQIGLDQAGKVAHFLLRKNNEASTSKVVWVYSKEYTTDPTKNPKLVVNYTEQAQPPPETTDSWYISPYGLDINTGTSTAQAVKTFTKAQSLMSAGDELYLMSGTYTDAVHGTLDITIDGVGTNTTSFIALDDGLAIVDGQNVDNPLDVTGRTLVDVQGIQFKNALTNNADISNSTNISVRRCSFYTTADKDSPHIKIHNGSSSVLIEDCSIKANGRYGIQIGGATTASNTLRRNYIYWDSSSSDMSKAAINICQSDNNLLENNLAVKNTANNQDVNGIHIGCSGVSTADNNDLYGNIVYNFDDGSGFAIRSESGYESTGNSLNNDISIFSQKGLEIRADTAFTADNITLQGNSNATTHGIYIQPESVPLAGANFDIITTIKNSSLRTGKTGSIGIEKVTHPNATITLNNTYNNITGFTTPRSSGVSAGTGDTTTALTYNLSTYGSGAYLMQNSSLVGNGDGGADRGAKVLYRYNNRTLTSSPLWPWAMEGRILTEISKSPTWDASEGIWKSLSGVYQAPVATTVTIDSVGTDTIGISWQKNLDTDFSHYEVHYATETAFVIGTDTQFGADITGSDTVTETITGLANSTTYYMKVRVEDTDGYYSDSTEVNATTGAGVPATRNARWPLDDTGTTTANEVINNYDGTVVGSGYNWVTGKIGAGAIELLGTDSFIEVGDNSDAFDIGTSTAGAIAFWFRPKAWPANTNGSLIGKYNWTVGHGGYWIRLTETDGDGFRNNIRAFVHGNTNALGSGAAINTESLTLDNWYHVALNIEVGATMGTATLYLNNQLKGSSVNLLGSVVNDTADFEIGNDGSSATNSYMNALFDDVRFYDHALTESEIGALYDAGAGQGNQPPTAVYDTAPRTNAPTTRTLDILTNDTDADGTVDWTTFTVKLSPTYGTIEYPDIAAEGTVTYTPSGASYWGTDTFTYSVRDNLGAESNDGLVSFPYNRHPVANDDYARLAKTVAINVVANDVDYDGTVDATSVTIVDDVDYGTTVVDAVTGVVTYTAGNTIQNDSFTYTIVDNEGLQCLTAGTVTIKKGVSWTGGWTGQFHGRWQ